MSNHYSAANLKFPGDDARLDFTDLYAFDAADPGKTILIMNANPYTAGMSAMPPFLMKSEFHPDGVYRINIDNNGDAHADVAFTFVFSELKDGAQTGTVYYATGPDARQAKPAGDVLISNVPVGFDASAEPVQAGPGRLFVGVRSDPFFSDADGAFHGFKWTGQDPFASRNILSIALEVPGEMLSADPEIGVWASVSVHRDGRVVQVDRGGHPTINPFVNPNDVKDQFNTRQPADDLENYLQPWSRLLADQGYGPAEAVTAARIVLPDILRYDRSRPAAYPNGRALTDDVFSARFAWLTNGKGRLRWPQATRRSHGRVPVPRAAQSLPGRLSERRHGCLTERRDNPPVHHHQPGIWRGAWKDELGTLEQDSGAAPITLNGAGDRAESTTRVATGLPIRSAAGLPPRRSLSSDGQMPPRRTGR